MAPVPAAPHCLCSFSCGVWAVRCTVAEGKPRLHAIVIAARVYKQTRCGNPDRSAARRCGSDTTWIKAESTWLPQHLSSSRCRAGSRGRKGAGRRQLIFSWGSRWTNWQPHSQFFFPCPLCIIRTANRIHAAATVVSY